MALRVTIQGHPKRYHTSVMSVAKPVHKSWCTLQLKIVIIHTKKAAGYDTKCSRTEQDTLDGHPVLTTQGLPIALTLCVKTFSFLRANLSVILYMVMRNSYLMRFNSSILQESTGISSFERSFQFKAIQFNLPHLNSTLRDQSDKGIVQDALGDTQKNKTHIFGLKGTRNKNTGRKGGKSLGTSSLIKLKMYTYGKHIDRSELILICYCPCRHKFIRGMNIGFYLSACQVWLWCTLCQCYFG